MCIYIYTHIYIYVYIYIERPHKYLHGPAAPRGFLSRALFWNALKGQLSGRQHQPSDLGDS